MAASATTSAHRRDEYLQAARLALHPARVQVELDLTAGIAVAEGVISVIDGDRTGTISDDEVRAYAATVREAIAIDVDGTPARVELVHSLFPGLDAMRRGEGPIRLQLEAALPALPAGSHTLRYRNTHRPDIGVYLANALVPEDARVAVFAQRRDVDQRELTIEYELRAGGSTPWTWTMAAFVTTCLAGGLVWWRRLHTS